MMKENKIIREFKGKSLIDFPDEFVAIDIETTGFDTEYDEIIEVGAIKIKDGKEIDSFSTLVGPKNEINSFITELTGINNDMVRNMAAIDKVLPAFIKFIDKSVIVGHNVNFDINFLYDNLIREGLQPITNDFVDTLRISRRLIPEIRHHRLIDLAEYFNINPEENHRALYDIRLTVEILKELKKFAKTKYSSIDEFKEECEKRKKRFEYRAKDIITTNIVFDEDNLLYDKYVVITGKLEKILRKEAMQIIADLGGHCQDSVTKDTNYLILGNNDYNPILKGEKSSKLLRAEELKLKGQDIEIISENVFYDIISQL